MHKARRTLAGSKTQGTAPEKFAALTNAVKDSLFTHKILKDIQCTEDVISNYEKSTFTLRSTYDNQTSYISSYLAITATTTHTNCMLAVTL